MRITLLGGDYDGQTNEFENHIAGSILVLQGTNRSFYRSNGRIDNETGCPVYEFVRYARDDNDTGEEIEPTSRLTNDIS